MRVIKDTTAEYETLFQSLAETRDFRREQSLEPAGYGNNVMNTHGNISYYFNQLFQHQLQMNNAASREELGQLLLKSLKRFIPLKNVELFIIDEINNRLMPGLKTFDLKNISYMNQIYRTEILDWIFDDKNVKVIPDMNESGNEDKNRLFFLLLPLFDGHKKKGILAIQTPQQHYEDNSYEIMSARLISEFALNKLELLFKRRELKKIYNELQTYQSKLTNDSTLSTLGELTNGTFESILSPLQTIMSYADLLQFESDESVRKSSVTIKNQVKKIENVIDRVVRFSSVNKKGSKIKIGSCNVNGLIEKYYEVVFSSFQNNNYEVILDLESNLPPVLSNPQYINHLLSNLVSLLRSRLSENGGILIQTRYLQNNVVIKVFSTDHIPSLADDRNELTNQEIKIIRNIMKKHEGAADFSSDKVKGSSVTFSFPLKRKIRK